MGFLALLLVLTGASVALALAVLVLGTYWLTRSNTLFLLVRRSPAKLHPPPTRKGSPDMSEEFDLDAIVAQRREAVGGDDVVFSWKGEKYNFPHPLLAPDEWKEQCADADADDVSQVRAMLGEEQYDRFHAAGGQAGFVMLIVQQVQQRLRDEMADGTPTRRSTSSRQRRKR